MLHYRQGDPTAPTDTEPRIVAHVVNDAGRWNSPAVGRRWPEARKAWRRWLEEVEFSLGDTQFVPVAPDVWVASMVARRVEDRPAGPRVQTLRYPALRKCLRAVREEAMKLGATVHLARLGDWPRVEAILLEEMPPDLEVYVYAAPPAGDPEPDA